MSETDLINQYAPQLLSFLIGLMSTFGLWIRNKVKIGEIRKTIDVVDDALKDDKITENEFRTIFASFKTLTKN